jgi:hypothetical protein
MARTQRPSTGDVRHRPAAALRARRLPSRPFPEIGGLTDVLPTSRRKEQQP